MDLSSQWMLFNMDFDQVSRKVGCDLSYICWFGSVRGMFSQGRRVVRRPKPLALFSVSELKTRRVHEIRILLLQTW